MQPVTTLDLSYESNYTVTRLEYILAVQELIEATGPYKAARDAYCAATATYTRSLYA
jgi:hypothetical protein